MPVGGIGPLKEEFVPCSLWLRIAQARMSMKTPRM